MAVQETHETPADADADTAPPVGKRRGWKRVLPAPYTLPGLIGALWFACLSFTPSLIPRAGFFQGVLAGATGAIGYGLGVAFASIWRAFADRDPRQPSRRTWQIFGVIAVALLLVAVFLGQQWQGNLRDLMGVEAPAANWVVVLPVTAALVFLLFVTLGRIIRRGYQALARLLARWMGERAARALGWVTVTVLVISLISGVLLDGLVSAMDASFSVRNGITAEGITQPTSSLRSSGQGSDIAWDSLGREGRKFVATGPEAKEITALTGKPAQYPIRAFAGLETADDAEDRANAAVDDLERAGGFKRSALLVATTTGSGWVDPASIETVEYMLNGDTATVAMQYSYLPSWLSYLVDQARAREAGRALFDAVYERWVQLPAADRPKLYVFGESLGSFGGEAAFSGEVDLSTRTDGAVFAGPPNFNTLWTEFTENREPGTPEILPVFRDGRIVRFVSQPGQGAGPTDKPWDGTRVLYTQHASDPIVWWSPNLIFNKPDWLREPRGSDVLPNIRWIPIVTFGQVSADLAVAVDVPTGHGHRYTTEYVDAWNTVLKPTGWSESQLQKLRDIVGPLN